MQMEKELYSFILWQKSRFMEKNIINDIKKNFEIHQSYEITWTPELFANNLARFYGKKLPKGCRKEKEIGCGPFLLLLVYDNNPLYDKNKRNLNIMSAKHKYRHLLGANLVYASDNSEETLENTLFLLGKNTKDIDRELAHPSVIPCNTDIKGGLYWNNIEEALDIAKKIPFTRVTPYKKSYLIHTRHADLVRRLLNARSHFKIPGRHKYFIKINKTKFPIYIRKIS